jgi:hypothetical protein
MDRRAFVGIRRTANHLLRALSRAAILLKET